MDRQRERERERESRTWILFSVFGYCQLQPLAFAMLRISSLVSVAKSQGQGLRIHHNYSNLSPAHHRATTACLPHICLEVAATLLHNQLRFNYRAMIATSSNKDREKAPVNLHAFLFLHSSTSFNATTVPRG